MTWRFIGAPRAEESAWQERVIADLAIGEWQKLTAEDDLDLVGPIARRMLTRHGVRYPVNSHLLLPLMEMAKGGALLTGWGGDQVLTGWRRPPRPTPRSALLSVLPDRLVAAASLHRTDPFPWLHRSVSADLIRRMRMECRGEPRGLGERLDRRVRSRDVVLANIGLDEVAQNHGVELIHPLLDPAFVMSLGLRFTDRQTLTRSDILADIADGSFPESATAARRKAYFIEVFLRGPTREFARSWDGEGLDTALVDRDALRQVWSQWPIPAYSAALVQYLWLQSAANAGPAWTPE